MHTLMHLFYVDCTPSDTMFRVVVLDASSILEKVQSIDGLGKINLLVLFEYYRYFSPATWRGSSLIRNCSHVHCELSMVINNFPHQREKIAEKVFYDLFLMETKKKEWQTLKTSEYYRSTFPIELLLV